MKLSVIVPVYNEEESLPYLYPAIQQTMGSLQLDWEIIFVDDGCTDGSLALLKDLCKKDRHHVRVVVFRRNYGQTAAIAAGIAQAKGDIVVLLDADLQNDPADIPIMISKLDEGYDVVSGWRKKRQDTFMTRIIPSRFANSLISWVTGVHLHDFGCTLKIYRREALTGFQLYGEMHRFIPVYAHSAGAKIAEVVVRHHPRKYGKSNYGIRRTFKVLLDLLTVKFLLGFSANPIYVFGGAGIGLIFMSMLALLFLAVRRIFFYISVLNSPFFQISVMLIVLGFQSILMGLIAELLMRTYHETLGKSPFSIRELINCRPDRS